ncbi:MAG: hypothetical protein AAFO03_20660 [Bacteroidota bacterium]
MTPDIRKLLTFLLSVGIGFLVLDFVGTKALDKLADSLKFGREYNTRLAIKEVVPDLLFIGASQCQGNYNSSIFEDSLGLKTFNAGMGAQHIDYQVVITNEIISRKTPQVIVWDFDPKLFADDTGVWLKLGLNPYYGQSDAIDSLLEATDAQLPLKHFVSSYRYNSLPMELLYYNRGKQDNQKGHSPFPCRKMKEMVVVDEYSYKLPGADLERKKTLMTTALKEWTRQGIEVLVIVSPLHKRIEHPIWGIGMAREICAEAQVPFYDFTNLEGIYDNGAYFRDHIHLCRKGAKLYSSHVAQLISSMLKADSDS